MTERRPTVNRETMIREIGRLESALARRERQLASYDRESDRAQLMIMVGALLLLSGIIGAILIDLGNGGLIFAIGVLTILWGGFLQGSMKEELADLEQEVEDLRVELTEHRTRLFVE